MLGQAAAMLIPFPATFTAKFDQGAFSFFGRGSPFAGTTIAAFGDSIAVVGGGSSVCGSEIGGIWRSSSVRGKRGFASDRRILIPRTVHTPGEKGGRGRGGESGGSSDRGGFDERLAARATTVDGGRHGNTSRFTAAGIFGGSSSHSSSSSTGSGSGGDTLATSNAVVGIDGAEGDGMGMVVSLGGMRERTREREFLELLEGVEDEIWTMMVP